MCNYIAGGMRDITPTKEVNSDDVESLNPSVSSALREYLPKHFSSAVPVALHSIRIEREWVGIMGFTPDSLPVIGPLAGRQRQYIAAGYTGHGMPFAFEAGSNIADMIASPEDSHMPEAFVPIFLPARFGL